MKLPSAQDSNASCAGVDVLHTMCTYRCTIMHFSHSSIHSHHTCTHSLLLLHPLTSHMHTLTHTPTHSLIHSLPTHSHHTCTHSPIHLPTHSFTRSPPTHITHAHTHPYTYPLTHSLAPPPTHSLSLFQSKELQVLFGHVKRVYLDKGGKTKDIWIQASSGMYGV